MELLLRVALVVPMLLHRLAVFLAGITVCNVASSRGTQSDQGMCQLQLPYLNTDQPLSEKQSVVETSSFMSQL